MYVQYRGTCDGGLCVHTDSSMLWVLWQLCLSYSYLHLMLTPPVHQQQNHSFTKMRKKQVFTTRRSELSSHKHSYDSGTGGSGLSEKTRQVLKTETASTCSLYESPLCPKTFKLKSNHKKQLLWNQDFKFNPEHSLFLLKNNEKLGSFFIVGPVQCTA